MADPAASEPRDLYLHIGTRKSGTTYVQEAVGASLQALADQGLGVPFSSWDQTYKKLFKGLLLIEEGEPVPAAAAKSLQALRALLDETRGSRLLISFEDLAALPDHRIAALVSALEGYRLHVILTARDLARQLPSEWQQSVKERLLASFPEYVDAVVHRAGPDAELFWTRQDAAEILGRWRRVVPAATFTLVTLPPSSAGRHLLPERFFSLLGVDPATVSSPQRSVNRSLGYREAEVLRRVNVAFGDRLPSKKGEYRVAVRKVLRGPLLRSGDKAPTVPQDQFDALLGMSREMVDRLVAEKWQVAGDLEDLLARPSGTQNPPPTDAELLEVAVDVLADISVARVEQIRAEWEKQKVLRSVKSAAQAPGSLLRRLRRFVLRAVGRR